MTTVKKLRKRLLQSEEDANSHVAMLIKDEEFKNATKNERRDIFQEAFEKLVKKEKIFQIGKFVGSDRDIVFAADATARDKEEEECNDEYRSTRPSKRSRTDGNNIDREEEAEEAKLTCLESMTSSKQQQLQDQQKVEE